MLDPYFGGDMEAAAALSGQMAGRIESVKLVAGVISETMAVFFDTINSPARIADESVDSPDRVPQ